jgi:PAS domain S-box-containing protein
MPSIKKARIYRFVEHGLFIVLIIAVVVLVILSVNKKLGTIQSYIGGGFVTLSLFVLFFIQQKLDGWFSATIAQADFAQDDAFTMLYDNSPVAYITIKTSGQIIGSNPSAVRMLQGEVDTINSVNFFELVQPESDFDPTILSSKVSAGLTVNDTEMSIKTFAGNTVWVMCSVYTYRNKGERLISLVDITEKKNIDTAKSEFVALATHQLRTPIAAVRWNVELLERNMRETKTEDQSRYLIKIERNVFRMIDLINDFLSASKLEMGTFATSEGDVNLTDFFSGIVDEFAEKISEKNITLDRQDIPPQLTIKTDSRLFHIIVSNLVSNSVKYLKPNGTILFKYELKGNSLEIIVADNGIGIPEEEINKLFTKFYRASNAQSHRAEGTGLGLYIVKQSVEKLGGVISVSSAVDQGARFVVTVPVTIVSIG